VAIIARLFGALVVVGSMFAISSGAASAPLPVAAPAAISGRHTPPAYYGEFKFGLPTSPKFFPIAVWDQDPAQTGDVPAPHADLADAFKAMGVNVFVGLYNWPQTFGSDSDGVPGQDELAAACRDHMYVIGGGDPASPSAADSVGSVLAVVAKERSCAKYLVGYQIGDEPSCTVNVPGQVRTTHSEDPTRMVYENEASWPAYLPSNLEGSAQCFAQAKANLAATDIASSDNYAITSPWMLDCREPDCLWIYGRNTLEVRSVVGPYKPVWMFIETGTDNLGQPEQNGSTCSAKTNLCEPNGNEYRATPAQVNSAAWLTLIEGANGLEWFCHDSIAEDYCAGGGANGHTTQESDRAIPANLSFIDHTVESFAPELNSPTVHGARIASSNGRVPIASMVKTVNGVTHLFVESDRMGSTRGTYGFGRALAGARVVTVYDSDERYDSKHSTRGRIFTLNSSGSFSDWLGANGDNYEVKIYSVTPKPKKSAAGAQ
jgi:hypothetical protein